MPSTKGKMALSSSAPKDLQTSCVWADKEGKHPDIPTLKHLRERPLQLGVARSIIHQTRVLL